jgi:long-subunit fatty acid transport protein
MIRTERTGALLVAASLLVLVLTPRAFGGDDPVAPLRELPFTSRAFHGARAMGMGGAALALADDGSALLTNPAGLARLRRIEMSAGLTRRTDDHSGSILGDAFDTSTSTTEISALRFAYPFPTFRGSLVFAFAGERVGDLNDDFFAVYEDDFDWGGEIGPSRYTEDLRAEGDVYAWTFGAAFDASERLSLGAALSFWSGSMSHHFEGTIEDTAGFSGGYASLTGIRNTEVDLSGLRLSLGALYYVSDLVTVGLKVDSPLTLATDATIDSAVISVGVQDTTPDGTAYYAQDYRLPFTFAAGIAVQPTDLLVVGADVSFTDWTELERDLELFTPGGVRREDYAATTDVSVGAELTLPSWPVRVRAGYATRPLAFQGLGIDTDRAYFTLGAGFLIDTVLAIDVAWVKGAHERSADLPYDERVDDTAVLLEAAYRF